MACSQVREQLLKGRQRITWYLTDQHGERHMAAQGEATRKSPFQYTGFAPFALEHPMPYCTNQQQVLRWVARFAQPGASFVMDPVEGGTKPLVPANSRPLPKDSPPRGQADGAVQSGQSPYSPVIVAPESPEVRQDLGPNNHTTAQRTVFADSRQGHEFAVGKHEAVGAHSLHSIAWRRLPSFIR
jgi:hypothetical protein